MASLSPEDLAQLAGVGITPERFEADVATLRTPPPPVRLVRPATIGDGIDAFGPDRRHEASIRVNHGDAVARDGRVMKFVPASGAATRMFGDLLAARRRPGRPSACPVTRTFFSQLVHMPFADALNHQPDQPHPPSSERDERRILDTLFDTLRLADLPKALVPFHRTDRVRTAFEEHLWQSTRYARDAEGRCRLHFTVAADAQPLFEGALPQVRRDIEAARGVSLDVTFSTQAPSTDAPALDADGAAVRTADGRLLLRPAGHGALLTNLQRCGGDLVVITNIDNVLPDDRSDEVARWKHLLIGHLALLEAETFAHLRALAVPAPAPGVVQAARRFATATFGRSLTDDTPPSIVISALDRPLRVCGVVRNEGEPGGAPFWVVDQTGRVSLQIVESAQVDLTDSGQEAIFRSATHFNPVDIVSSLRGFKGEPFDLAPFVDPQTAFVTEKAVDGRTIRVLERPGLWNGAMAGWNTVCVEVPSSTFAPVKTILDLLRPQHQPCPPRG